MSTASWRSVGIAAGAVLTALPCVAQSSIPVLASTAAYIGGGGTDAEGDKGPPGSSKPSGDELEVMALLSKVAAAYAEAATHERVAIKYAGPNGEERFDQMQVSMDPGRAGNGRRLAVSMGSLRVQVVEGLVSAVSESAVGRVFRAALGEDLSSTSIAKVLPPLPIPSLEFLGARGVVTPGSMTPYANGVIWESRAERPTAGESWAVIHGSAGETRVALTVDLQTWRIRHVEILGRQAGNNWSLDCSVTPIAAPERDPFAPMTESLQPVATLAELVAAQLPVQPGARVPSLTLMDRNLHAWSLGTAFSRQGSEPSRNPMVALVLYRAGSEAARADAEAAALAVSQTAGRMHADIAVHPVMVYELREFQVIGVQQEASMWDPSMVPLASTAGRELLDRFAPGRNAAVVLIDEEHRLVGALACDGRSSDPASLGARLRETITATR